ncbi:hypothetical protein CsSME_00030514 [Camellia sinensis var. sinensis]
MVVEDNGGFEGLKVVSQSNVGDGEQHASDMVIVSPIMAEGGRANGEPNSFVRNVKSKVKKKLKLPEFGYPTMRGRGKKANRCVMRAIGDGMGVSVVGKEVIDVDEVIGARKKWSSLVVNNWRAVRKMLTNDKKKRITDAYDRDGDGAVMWASCSDGVNVYATDMLTLVR